MRTLLFAIALCCCAAVRAQVSDVDSLKNLLAVTDEGAKHITLLESLSFAYLDSHPDSALQYALDGLQLAQKINNKHGEAICTNAIGNVYFHIGDNAKALETYLHYLRLKEAINDNGDNLAVAYYNIASVYTEEQDYNHALSYLLKARLADEKAKDSSAILYDIYSLGSIYLRMNIGDSGLLYSTQAYQLNQRLKDKSMDGAILNTIGEAWLLLKNNSKAADYYRFSIPFAEAADDKEVLTADYYGLAKVLQQKSNTDSTVYYARKALSIALEAPFLKQVLEISTFLTGTFSQEKRYDSAFRYQALSIKTKDSLFNVEQVKKVQNLKLAEQQRQQAIETARIKFRARIKIFIAVFIAVIILITAVVLWYINKRRKDANEVLREQKQKLKKTLRKLRNTQAQLIQKEKMASLGELTAGIAHEIQNPLNFVNNFSEVSNELMDELNEELSKGDIDEAKAIGNDIKQNLSKINHHGRRADAIVKGMLQHSAKSSGEKEPTDINALCEEYLKLSYHGLRAKDKNFNAHLETHFDNSIQEINIIAQDVGRALLNVFNNAFYAVNQKKKTAGEEYKPAVTIITTQCFLEDGRREAEIKVIDNGNGIEEKIMHKIFQPFFTTKPTGQGTGLGLSMAYDIIVKEHSGTIKVGSTGSEGNQTVFIISLPV